MKIQITKRATSIAEAMVVMLIIVTWVTWMYKIYWESNHLSNSTTNKIQAIQIATQWIEWFTNIRDTNWLLFSSDYINCWNTLNYDSNCIWAIDTDHTIKNNESYIIYTDADNRRVLESPSIMSPYQYIENDYRNWFKMYYNDIWVYTQSWTITEVKPIFTRELKIDYLNIDGTPWNESSKKIKVTALVQRSDSSSSTPHKVEIEQILTNWKQ